MRRILLWGLGAGTLFLLIANYSFYSGDMIKNSVLITAPAGERALFESGENAYYELLSRASAYNPGEYMLVLSVDQLGQPEFLSYRACYQLYPIRPIYIPLSFMPPASSRFSITPDPNLVYILRDRGVKVAVLFMRPDPQRSAYYRVVLEADGKLTLVKLPMLPAPALPPEPRLSMWLVGLGLTAAFGAGVFFLSGLFKGIGAGWLTTSALSFYAGIGLTACLMVTLGVFHVPFSIPAILIGWAVLLAVLGVRWFRLRQLAVPPVAETVTPIVAGVASGGMGWPDRVGVGLAAFCAFWALSAVAIPMSAWGNWDTWAIWNLKAKACLLARGIPFPMLGEQIYKFSHHDYPLGLPMLHAWLATWAGGIGERLLRLLSPFYLFTLFFLIAGLLKELGVLKGRWLIAAAFISVPKVIQQGYSGYADLPVACGMTAVLLLLVRVYRGAPVGWAVCLFSGIAALHKDEGLIWGGTSILLMAIWAHRGRVKWRQVIIAGLILIAMVAPWKVTASRMGLVPNDYKVKPAKMIEDAPERLPQIARAVMLETLGPGVSMSGIAGMESPSIQWWYQFRGAWFLMWYAVLLWGVMGFRRWFREPVLAWLALLPLVQASAYTAVYTASISVSLPWHITTSLDRLLLQIAPSVYVLAAASCFGPRPPVPIPESGIKNQRLAKTKKG